MVNYTLGDSLGQMLMIGDSNADWVPCIFELESVVGTVVSSGWTLKNVDGTDVVLQFRLPIPTSLGNLKLHIGNLAVGIQDADATDYLTEIIVRGVTYNSSTTLLNDATNCVSAQRKEYTLAATDVSSYNSVMVGLYLFCTSAGDVDISFVEMNCYYDT